MGDIRYMDMCDISFKIGCHVVIRIIITKICHIIKYRDATSVVRHDDKLSSTSIFRRDATSVVRHDANLSRKSFFRRDATSVVRHDANLSSTSFFQRDATSVVRLDASVLVFLSLRIHYFCVSR